MNTRETELKLLPCPFCGLEPVLRRTIREYGEDSDGPAGEYEEWVTIHCDECGIKKGEEYRSDAIEAWNRRAQ